MLKRFIRSSACFWSALAASCCALFWPSLFEGQMPAFRDAFHFYLPQAMWLDEAATAGDWFPLWQPAEGLGLSIPGETTSALFYPLRAICMLPQLSITQRHAIFMVAHLLLAAAGMSYACARWQLRRESGWLAGAAYALSCPVLFQHNNWVYLCSAAWLGFALAELGCLLKSNSFQRPCQPRLWLYAASLAMMVLAGDPHTAVNVVIVAFSVTLIQMFTSAQNTRSLAITCRPLLWLVVGTLLALGLSAVQCAPSIHWAQHSHRVVPQHSSDDVAIASLADQRAPARVLDWLDKPATERALTYDFSLSPWHLATLVLPTLGGSYAPTHSRLFALFPAEGRMWVPSLFLGLIPLLLIGRRWWLPRMHVDLSADRWLLHAALLALLASFGNYSLGWMLRTAIESLGLQPFVNIRWPADHLSSLYGLLVELLPGYSMFRYPAKWSVLFVGCSALLAAHQLNRLDGVAWAEKSVIGRSGLCIGWTIAGLLLCVAWGAQADPQWTNRLESAANLLRQDVLIGRPDMLAIFHNLGFACCVPMMVMSLLKIVQWRCGHLIGGNYSLPSVHGILVWVTLLELFVTSTRWMVFVDAPTTSSVLASAQSPSVWVDASEVRLDADQWMRAEGLPAVEQPVNHDRQSDRQTSYQRQFLLGKLGLIEGVRNFGASMTIEPRLQQQLRGDLQRLDHLTETQPELDQVLAWLGVQRRLVRHPASADRPAQFHWHAVADARPQFDLQVVAPQSPPPSLQRAAWRTASVFEAQVLCSNTCRLVVRQFDDGGWRLNSPAEGSHPAARISSSPGDLFLTVTLDAGQHHLRIDRDPAPIRNGALVSILSAVGLCLAAACSIQRKGSNWANRAR